MGEQEAPQAVSVALTGQVYVRLPMASRSTRPAARVDERTRPITVDSEAPSEASQRQLMNGHS